MQKAAQATLTLNAGTPLTYNTSETLTTSGGARDHHVGGVTSGSSTVVGNQVDHEHGTRTCAVTATKAAATPTSLEATATASVTVQKAAQATLTVKVPGRR